MDVLVTYASRHGSTEEIAARIAAVLAGHEDGKPCHGVTTAPVDDIDDVEGYDATVLGSAVYLGRWLPQALAFVGTHEASLRHMPLWLFSSGPVGEAPGPVVGGAEESFLPRELDAAGSRTFPGRIRTVELDATERSSIRAGHVADGDYRDWHDIDTWASEIRDALDRITTEKEESS